MRKRIFLSIFCVCMAALLLWWGVNPIASQETEVEAATVGLLLDTDIGTGALQMKQGAKLAAKEQKVELTTVAPDNAGTTVIGQAELLLSLLDKGVKAILLVPATGEDLSYALKQAEALGVPVLTLGGTPLPGKVTCTIGDDYRAVGRLAAQALADRLRPPASVLVLAGAPEDSEAALRLEGALPVLENAPGITLVASTYPADASPEGLSALFAAYPGLNGVLCLTGAGTENAAKAMSRQGKTLCLVGIDCGQNRTTYLENRQVDAMVLGMPFAMGYLGVQFAAQSLAGQSIPASYSTESRVIDVDNMYLPENQKLAFPILQ